MIKLGMIGTGRIAGRFVNEVRPAFDESVSICAVYNPHTESVKAFGDRFKIQYFDKADAFFAYVDAVYIASPHETHYEYAKKAFMADKHVLCEKPMTLRCSEAEELFDIASQRKLVFMEGIKTAYCPGFSLLKKVLSEGRIGEVKYIESCFTKLESSTSRELTDVKYGGSMTELGSYVLLPALSILGTQYEDVRFESIYADNGLDIFTKVSLKYKDGLVTSTCGLGVKSEGRLMIGGTKGYVLVPAPWWKTSRFEVHYEDPNKVDNFTAEYEGEGIRYEVAEFLNRIKDERVNPDVLSKEESIAIADIMEKFRLANGREG